MARRCEWFVERCADIIKEENLIEFVGRVAAGKENDHKVTREGVIDLPAALRDRLEAFRMLAEWGVGKPIQIVITAGTNTTPADSVRQAQQIFDMVKDLETGTLKIKDVDVDSKDLKSHIPSNGSKSNGK